MGNSEENSNKNEHGLRGKKALKKMIETLKAREYISDYKIDYRVEDPAFGEKQFFFQSMIEFDNQERWILHSTTSVRDRISEQQWNSFNIKRLNEYVKKAYVVVPDELEPDEKNNAESYDRKIQERRIFSALDGVVSFDKMYQMIEGHGAELLGSGRGKARLGLHLEEKLVDSLNNPDNLKIYNGTAVNETGYLYELFYKIMEALGIPKGSVKYIIARSDIPKLKNGGSPKADVYMEIDSGKIEPNSRLSFTFSCKRSSEENVSVHEYTADAFSDVLNPSDEELRYLLNSFQKCGGINSMNGADADLLKDKMIKYESRLNKWVLGGYGGTGELKTQCASHIVTYNDKTGAYSVYSIEQYIEKCYERKIRGQFGTIYQWTYPSGGKGKRIQLKAKIL